MSPKLILVIFCLSFLAMLLGSSGAVLRGVGAGCEGCGEEALDSFLGYDRYDRAYGGEGTRRGSELLNMLMKKAIVGARARRNPPHVAMDISTMLLGELLGAGGDGERATTDHNMDLFRQAGK
ncbi:uncharacterized protein LOC144866775 [Branchiostoma floridae x Branchiostoma japonicum]